MANQQNLHKNYLIVPDSLKTQLQDPEFSLVDLLYLQTIGSFSIAKQRTDERQNREFDLFINNDRYLITQLTEVQIQTFRDEVEKNIPTLLPYGITDNFLVIKLPYLCQPLSKIDFSTVSQDTVTLTRLLAEFIKKVYSIDRAFPFLSLDQLIFIPNIGDNNQHGISLKPPFQSAYISTVENMLNSLKQTGFNSELIILLEQSL